MRFSFNKKIIFKNPTSYLREMEQYLIDSTGSSLILIFYGEPSQRGVVCKPANKTTSEPTKIYDSFKSFKPSNDSPCTRGSCQQGRNREELKAND